MNRSSNLTPAIAEELRRLALLPDDQILVDDAPEVTDWSKAQRARFFRQPVVARNYDVRAIANWTISKLKLLEIEVSNLSLNKLVYFFIERSLIERSVLLSPARIEAWEHGPVIREIYHFYKQRDDRSIVDLITKFSIADRRMQIAMEDFLVDDIAFFESVCATYARQSASKLRNLSHVRGGAWDTVWMAGRKKNPGMVISPEIILSCAPLKRQIDD